MSSQTSSSFLAKLTKKIDWEVSWKSGFLGSFVGYLAIVLITYILNQSVPGPQSHKLLFSFVSAPIFALMFAFFLRIWLLLIWYGAIVLGVAIGWHKKYRKLFFSKNLIWKILGSSFIVLALSYVFWLFGVLIFGMGTELTNEN